MKQRPSFFLVYEDGGIIAVNKAAGVSVTADRWDGSRERLDKLVAAFLARRDAGAHAVPAADAGGVSNAVGAHDRGTLYLVHRIDRGTSGLVVFARNAAVHKRLSAAFETRQVRKRYIAAVCGRPLWQETVCDLPLVPDGNKRHLTIIDRFRGKKSLTRFVLLGSAGNFSIVEALPETGRTHQIRVHLAALGHPVVCDELYGAAKPALLSAIKRDYRGDLFDERPLLARLGLHAAELTLPGGAAGGGLTLTAPLPRDMAALINQMEKAAGRKFAL
ncbi:MAG: ribosomal large subunit pseudouridine synthase A RluA [Treponematales bacterium]